MRRARRRRTDAPPLRIVVVGTAVLAVLLGVGFLAVTLNNGVPLRDYEMLRANVPSVGNLQRHDFVRLGGVRVGQVRDLDVGADGRARVSLQLDPGAPRLPADSTVVVRANGLLGARYVELVPGQATRTLADNSTIRAGDPSLTYGVPDVLQTFDPRTRRRFATSLEELSTGVAGRAADLNVALHEGTITQTPIQRLIGTLRAPNARLRLLLPSLAQLTDSLAAARQDIGAGFAPIAAGVRPFNEGRADLQDTLERAPGALRAARDGLGRGRALLGSVSRLSHALDAALPPAPRGLASVRLMLRDGRRPLERAAGLLDAARVGTPATLRLLQSLGPVLRPARAGLDDFGAIAAELGRYGCDIQSVGATWRSMTGVGSNPPGKAGPLGAFRLGIVPTPLEAAGLTNPLSRRDGYSAPCTYLSTTYPVVQR